MLVVFCVPVQNRAALLSLMVDVAVMLGAPDAAARVQMEKALAFETKLAHVRMFALTCADLWMYRYIDAVDV